MDVSTGSEEDEEVEQTTLEPEGLQLGCALSSKESGIEAGLPAAAEGDSGNGSLRDRIRRQYSGVWSNEGKQFVIKFRIPLLDG